MRIHLAIIFSLVCTSAIADGNSQASTITPVGGYPLPIGRHHNCNADYPDIALKAHAEGKATLSFVVGADGNVRDPKILISSGSKELDDASLQCVMRWRYMPLSRDGKPYDVMWQAGVYWKPGYPPDVSRAEWCLAFRKGERAIPKGVANTSVTFRVMPDGTMKDTSIARSSGDRSLDEAAIRCMNSGYFDTSILTLPTEGIAGHADLDWAQAAPLPPPLPPLPPLSSTPPK